VAVDIRKSSPSFGKWIGKILNAENRELLYIPEGFAHGFCVLSEVAQVVYYCSQVYSAEHERGMIWNDPDIGIQWPIENPQLSEKDQNNSSLRDVADIFDYSEIKSQGDI